MYLNLSKIWVRLELVKMVELKYYETQVPSTNYTSDSSTIGFEYNPPKH